ncbi:MAG: carboxypeptidase regulatory-like domain-containing protein, partial [Acidobacteria bacterium]|nr:carboxypeptidase regulatory-like domain-containing protein [Acidobacteriota bacterium]
MPRTVRVLCLLLLCVVSAQAQRTTGAINGQVVDPTGAVIVGARVEIQNEATGFKVNLLTNAEGRFEAPNLMPANYKLKVEHPGFKTYTTIALVRVGVTTPIEAKMELGAAQSIVTVEATTIAVDTAKATVQGVVTGERIDQLPLNGRNFLDLAQQEPGVQLVDGGSFDPTKNQFVGVSIGGRSGRVTRIQVDGVDITDETVGTTVSNISNESIQEFGVSTSSLDASTDVTSSGAVNIITRSGGNAIHGSAFGFFRDAKFAADQRLNKTSPTTAKPPFDRQNWGGRSGGWFVKDRLFWHVEYEQTSQDAARFTNIPEFPQFTGAFAVPLDETIAGARLDWKMTDQLSGFYRFSHNHNFGVTGFGGRDLAAFGNRNNTNFHVVGVDYGTAKWTHGARFAYVNFNNVIAPANAAAGTPNTLDPGGRAVLVRIAGILQDVGPDLLAPQQTFQDNKQTKYDGSYIAGNHTFRFGAEWNRIEQFVFAAFFGLAPRILAIRTPTTRAFANTNPFGPGGDTNPLNYPLRQVVLGNGLGYFSEKPALGFPFGGTTNHRLAYYFHDTWKVSNNFTATFGLRYTWHSALSNSDLERTPVINLFDPELGGRPNRDANDFAPQAGFAWNLFGNNRWVIRGGAGLYYETNIFNNLLFDRVLNIPPGIGFDVSVLSSGNPLLLHPATGATLFNFSTDCFGGTGSCFNQALGSVITDVVAGQATLQTASAALAANWPPPGVPPLFNQTVSSGGSLLDPHYKTPYGIQMNIGLQYEVKPGLVLSADYVRNRGVHFNLIRDRNRLGAADTLHVPTATAAMNATAAAFGCATGTLATDVDCVITAGGTISDYANNGLGGGSGVDGNAFSGMNRNFRDMGIIEPAGLSLYHGLNIKLSGRVGSWSWFKNVSTNITYSISRFESTGADQDFLSNAGFNDKPTKFFGPAGLDRLHQFGLSFQAELPLGIKIASSTAMKSSLPSSLFLPQASGGADEIFFSDLDGDGVTQDPITGTNRGSFSRSVSASDLPGLITKFSVEPRAVKLEMLNRLLFNATASTENRSVILNFLETRRSVVKKESLLTRPDTAAGTGWITAPSEVSCADVNSPALTRAVAAGLSVPATVELNFVISPGRSLAETERLNEPRFVPVIGSWVT